jgi:hypothetical protein
MAKRRLSTEEIQTIIGQQGPKALSFHPGSFRKVVVAQETDDNGAPVVMIVLAGQSDIYLPPAYYWNHGDVAA